MEAGSSKAKFQFILHSNHINIMQQSYVEVILVFVLMVEVLFLIFSDHIYFAVYIDVVVICLFITASYLAYRYFQITQKMPRRVTPIKTAQDYQFQLEKSSRSQTDKLLKSKEGLDFVKMKTSRLSKKNDEEEDPFLAELQQKEEEIFNFSQ